MSALEPVTIVEIEEQRCSLRFGVGDCPATGSNPCYNTWGTCPVRAAYDGTARVRWRFVDSRPGRFACGDYSDENDLATDAIPVPALSVSTTETALNAAGVIEGKSPMGTRAGCSVRMGDFLWRDQWGDPYAATRAARPDRFFWAVWTARNPFVGQTRIRIYDGYMGQALSAMRQRLYHLHSIDGPDATGMVTLEGIDPLRIEGKWPPVVDVKLADDILADDMTIRVRTTDDSWLTTIYGNTAEKWARIGGEVITYTTVTEIEPGVHDLTVTARGLLDTPAADAKAGAAVGRVGRFQRIRPWEVLKDHILPAGGVDVATYVDADQWAEEGDYLAEFVTSAATVEDPTDIEVLVGELCQQGAMMIWWDEVEQTIPMRAVRPAFGVLPRLTDAGHIVKGSARLRRDPDAVVSRVFVRYDRQGIKSLSDRTSLRTVEGIVNTETEVPQAIGKAKTIEIAARWITADTHAIAVMTRILARYLALPRFLVLTVDSKDRGFTVGAVAEVETRHVVDADGNLRVDQWQVIGAREVKAGEAYLLDMQSHEFVGRFGGWMADDAPDYGDATAEEQLTGFWWGDDDGLVGGDPGYTWS